MKPILTVIVPCFNEQDALPLFHKAVTKVLQSMPTDYELLFVNDGSKDDTLSVLRFLAQKDTHVNYLSFSRNFGKEAAMFAGMQEAKGDYVVLMDADLQHPVDLLPQMFDAVAIQGYDCAAGKRLDRDEASPIRNALSKAFYKVLNALSPIEMSDGAGDFRMMNRPMVNAILELKEYNRYLKGIFSFVGFETKWIEFHNVERVAGSSKWHFKSLFAYALEGIFSFSSRLISISSTIGTSLLAIATLVFAYVAYDYLMGVEHKLLALACLVLFISGIQILCIAMVGQYSAKDYMESKKRPLYIIKEKAQR